MKVMVCHRMIPGDTYSAIEKKTVKVNCFFTAVYGATRVQCQVNPGVI